MGLLGLHHIEEASWCTASRMSALHPIITDIPCARHHTFLNKGSGFVTFEMNNDNHLFGDWGN